MNDSSYSEYRLDNGLLVAIQRTPTKTFSGALTVYQGGLQEKINEEGLTHFLEHTLVTGGSLAYSPEEGTYLAAKLGSFNAFTLPDRIMFPGSSLIEELDDYLKITSGIFSPQLDEAKIEQERFRILRELADSRGNLYIKQYMDWMNAEIAGENNPYF